MIRIATNPFYKQSKPKKEQGLHRKQQNKPVNPFKGENFMVMVIGEVFVAIGPKADERSKHSLTRAALPVVQGIRTCLSVSRQKISIHRSNM